MLHDELYDCHECRNVYETESAVVRVEGLRNGKRNFDTTAFPGPSCQDWLAVLLDLKLGLIASV